MNNFLKCEIHHKFNNSLLPLNERTVSSYITHVFNTFQKKYSATITYIYPFYIKITIFKDIQLQQYHAQSIYQNYL